MGMMLSPAAPPPATMMLSPGFTPSCTVISWIALIICSPASVSTAEAASSAESLSGSATFSSAWRRGGDIEAHAPAEKIARIDVAEHDGGVGDGGLTASLAVAGGAGAGARALRAGP